MQGDLLGLLITGRQRILTESHSCEAVGENVVGLHKGSARTVKREVPVAIVIHSVLAKKICPTARDGEPSIIPVGPVVEHRERPNLPRLEPDELVRVKNSAPSIQARKVSSIFPIHGVIFPERDCILEKSVPMEICERAKV